MDYFERNVLQTDFAMEMLDYYDVSRVTVTYEKLYFTEHAEEWMKIFRYLGVGPRQNLTKATVLSKIEHVETHPLSRHDAIGNYEAVEAALNETEFAKYLTPISVMAEHDTIS